MILCILQHRFLLGFRGTKHDSRQTACQIVCEILLQQFHFSAVGGHVSGDKGEVGGYIPARMGAGKRVHKNRRVPFRFRGQILKGAEIKTSFHRRQFIIRQKILDALGQKRLGGVEPFLGGRRIEQDEHPLDIVEQTIAILVDQREILIGKGHVHSVFYNG